MKRIRLICCLLAATILTISLSGCIQSRILFPDTVNKLTARFAISLGFDEVNQNIESKLIETDSYGRQMFWIAGEYILCSGISPERSFYVIQQRSERKGVYYYEDIAWCFDDTEGDELEQWKKQNDWGLPLREEKMSFRECHATVEGYNYLDNNPISYSQVNDNIATYVQETGRHMKTYWLADSDGITKELWVVELITESGETEESYVILTKGEEITGTSLLVTEALTDRSAFTQFKYENGWHYPEELINILLNNLSW